MCHLAFQDLRKLFTTYLGSSLISNYSVKGGAKQQTEGDSTGTEVSDWYAWLILQYVESWNPCV